MQQPHHIPAAWRGDELLRRDDWSRTISADDLSDLLATAVRTERSGHAG